MICSRLGIFRSIYYFELKFEGAGYRVMGEVSVLQLNKRTTHSELKSNGHLMLLGHYVVTEFPMKIRRSQGRHSPFPE
jgi:hypothetical protein